MTSTYREHWTRVARIIRAACHMVNVRVVSASSYWSAVQQSLISDLRTPEGNLRYHITANTHGPGTLYLIYGIGESEDQFTKALAWATAHVYAHNDIATVVVVLWTGATHASQHDRVKAAHVSAKEIRERMGMKT